MSELKVGVLGARGKVGRVVCEAVDAAHDMLLVAAVDQDDDVDTLVSQGVEAVVDFTHPDAVMDNLEFCIDHGIHAVVGTTGFDDARLDQLREWLSHSPQTGVPVAPNFSVGAVLMMRFAAEAARFFESVEIVELHHPDKAGSVGYGAAHGGADRRGPPRGRTRGPAGRHRHRASRRTRSRGGGHPRARPAGPRPGRAPGGADLFSRPETLAIVGPNGS